MSARQLCKDIIMIGQRNLCNLDMSLTLLALLRLGNLWHKVSIIVFQWSNILCALVTVNLQDWTNTLKVKLLYST